MKSYIYNIAELLILLFVAYCYPFIKRSYMKWFLPFLTFVFLGDFLGKIQFQLTNKPNYGIHYLIGIVESCFYCFIFYSLTKSKEIKKMTIMSGLLCLIIYLGSYFFYRNNLNTIFWCVTICGFFIVTTALAFLYKMAIDIERLSLCKEPGFWISFGVSLFFSGISISFSLHDYIIKNDLQLFGQVLHNTIPQILSLILYSCIIIAIILCKKKTKTSSLPS